MRKISLLSGGAVSKEGEKRGADGWREAETPPGPQRGISD